MGFACHCCGFEKEREIDEMIIIKGILDLFGVNGRGRKRGRRRKRKTRVL
jgi:hypothetical protein